ncbi:hypothetical protein C7460_1051, partial [Marinoscillum furvescens DSM 4134]
NQELTLDVSDLNQGVYLLNFIDTEKSGSKTIVSHKIFIRRD